MPDDPPQPPSDPGVEPGPPSDPGVAEFGAARPEPPSPFQQTAWSRPTDGSEARPGYPAPGLPAPPGPPYPIYMPQRFPEPRKSRRWIIALSAVLASGLVLVCVVLGVVGMRLLNEDTAPLAGPPAASPGQTSSSEAARGRTTLSAPARIGTLVKSSKQDPIVDELRKTLKANGLRRPFAAIYEDSSNTARTVMVWGATGRNGRESAVISGFFRGAEAEVGDIVDRRRVPAGTRGGTTECGHTGERVAFDATVCVWVTDDAILAMAFVARSIESSVSLAPKIIAAVAKRV